VKRPNLLPRWPATARAAAALALCCIAPLASGQAGLFAYPSAGQSDQTQRQDRFECHEWAVGQTGFDPMSAQAAAAPGPVAAAPPPQSGFFGRRRAGQGGMVRDAAGGAALGAIGGAIAGDAGEGAAIGAVTGTLFGGIRRRQRAQEQAAYQQHQQAQMAQQQAQQQAQIAAATDEYRRAWSACMRARKYDVQ
jgi:hypothetical protein